MRLDDGGSPAAGDGRHTIPTRLGTLWAAGIAAEIPRVLHPLWAAASFRTAAPVAGTAGRLYRAIALDPVATRFDVGIAAWTLLAACAAAAGVSSGEGTPAVGGTGRGARGAADAVAAEFAQITTGIATGWPATDALNRPAPSADADLIRAAGHPAGAAMVLACVRIDAEIVAGLHAVQLRAAPLARADLDPGRVAAAFGVGGAGRIARTTAIAPDTVIAALAHVPGTAALAGTHVKLHPAAARLPLAALALLLVLASAFALRLRFRAGDAGQSSE